ncbi:acetylornithine deacetylase [Aliiroseovarius lamellibrachiae]|uniref:acetylornithine deacetylase n=1 Tax=Aliiroseovarius lamellibrachiae TaxID=1924933 RepID=UPI001BE0542B|nr:acetylornithine deacetylase [Aliiroseovarius lamellibrachiae]MBT2130887.1 acetylornithine deacetylase [Aliiroseovarius lamellibrachiae]
MTFDLTPREILEKLVSIPTVSRDSNLDLVDWVEGYLTHHGVPSTRVQNDAGTKASLYAHIGPEVEGGVILSGHTDVVPVEGQSWATDPWQAVEIEGRIYGRGTCDMKGFVALMLAAVPIATTGNLKRPIQIALSYDEEVGCLGAPQMIAEMAQHLPKAAMAIIGEPSMMKVVTGHKAAIGWATSVHGHEVHSSLMHTGVSAVMQAAKLVNWANETNDESARATPRGVDAMFDPPYSTLHVGTIRGGTAENITAKECRFVVGLRALPGQDLTAWKGRYLAKIAELEADMKAIHPDAGITVSTPFFVPGLQPERNGAAEGLARRLTGDNGQHVVSYGTEAGQFQSAGFSAVICGPGDIAQAHQPNEYLSVAQFEAGWDFMRDLLKDLSK